MMEYNDTQLKTTKNNESPVETFKRTANKYAENSNSKTKYVTSDTESEIKDEEYIHGTLIAA